MRSVVYRVAAAIVAIVAIASCDTAPMAGVKTSTGATETPTGTSTGTTGSTGSRPQAQIDSPATSSINLGDTLLVAVRLHDLVSMTNTTISALTYHGDVDLGTLQVLTKYGPVTVPASGSFPPGTKDTVVRRILPPILPLDSAADSLVIQAVTVDSLGGTDTTRRTYAMYAGPSLVVFTPKASDTLPAGIPFRFVAEAKHPLGLSSLTFSAKGDSSFKTKLDTTVVKSYTGSTTDKTDSIIVTIPGDAPAGSKLTLTVTALDLRAQTKTVSFTVPIRAAGTTPIRVTQNIGNRLEIGDTISVHATGDGIVFVGYVARDSVGTTVYRDSIAQPGTSNGDAVFRLDSIPVTAQGHNLAFTGFAWDKAGNIGYAAASGSDTSLTTALVDSALIVYGRTYSIPQNRSGTMADLAVDQPRGKVYLSNMFWNRLELWTGSAGGGAFDPLGVSVGSLPWGMTVDLSGDTLLVANSGGTNISKVVLTGTPAEAVSKRLLTRATVVYTLHESFNPENGTISIGIDLPPTQYSDRPQYIAVSKAGRLYYSTRPTSSATPGTIRYLDPAQTVPDPHQIYQYGDPAKDSTEYAVFNADSIKFAKGADGITRLDICDHKVGTTDYPGSCANAATIEQAVADINAYGGDVVAVKNLDVASLALEDTTFVASSVNHDWIGFGEGNTSGTGRVMMVHDPVNPGPEFLSPSISVTDLVNNASEHVFGLALDSTGSTLGVHGASSYFATVDSLAFHLRLQGVYGSFSSGAGFAFHPLANGANTPDANNRLAFIASANSTVEVVDIAHYVNRGVLPTKHNFYGALRVSLPFPTDKPDIVLKLFGLTAQGLVVIDIRQNDIKPAP